MNMDVIDVTNDSARHVLTYTCLRYSLYARFYIKILIQNFNKCTQIFNEIPLNKLLLYICVDFTQTT